MSKSFFADDALLGHAGSDEVMDDWGAWVDELDPLAHPELVHLREHSYTTNPETLGHDLEAALSGQPPGDPAALSVAKRLLSGARACPTGTKVFFLADTPTDNAKESPEPAVELSREERRSDSDVIEAHAGRAAAVFGRQLAADLKKALERKKGKGPRRRN